MLPRAARLTSGQDFTQTVRSGRRAGGRSIVVHLDAGAGALPGSGERAARAGLVVSRSVGTAVTRNRVKRRLRHLVRGHLEELPRGSRLVVRALPAAAAASSAQLDLELRRAIDRAATRAATRAVAGTAPAASGSAERRP